MDTSPLRSAHRFDPAAGTLSVDLQRIRAFAQTVTKGMPEAEQLAFARAFSHRTIAQYWTRVCAPKTELLRLVPCPVEVTELDDWADRQASRIAEDLSRFPKPLASYILSCVYATLLPDQQRSRNGVFFTPPALVDQLLGLVEANGVAWHSVRVMDPAAGCGAFICAVAERVRAALLARGASDREIVAHVGNHVFGVELDPYSAWMSNVLLESALWEHCIGSGERLASSVSTGNALELPEGFGEFDLVIGNPPYGRVVLEPATRARFGRSLFGHANLYGVFMDLAVRLCREGGLIGFVTPASFLGGEYFKRLREILLHLAPPRAIDFVSDRAGVFEQVLQETVLSVFARGERCGGVGVRVARPSAMIGRCQVAPLGTADICGADVGAPWILPRTRADAGLLAGLGDMPHRLADYGLRVSTGPLVWNRHKRQLVDQPGTGRYPLIWAESVLPEGVFSFRSERKNHTAYFQMQPGQKHLLIRDSVVLVQRTTSKEQTRRIQAAVLSQGFLNDHGGAVVENHLNMVRPVGGRLRVSLDAVAALLNSEVLDTIFRCTSGSVAVSAYELESLPVPPPEAMQHLNALLQSNTGRGAIESFLRRAYGQAAEAAA